MTRIRRLDAETEDEVLDQGDIRQVLARLGRRMSPDRARELLGLPAEDAPVTHGGTGSGAR